MPSPIVTSEMNIIKGLLAGKAVAPKQQIRRIYGTRDFRSKPRGFNK